MSDMKACRAALLERLAKQAGGSEPELQLENGARVAVVGGGPAGSMFAYFLLRLAEKIDLQIAVDIYEPRHFNHFGPAGCNHCGGIISESLVQLLAMEGIELPPEVVQRGIDAYELHTDVGSVRIETPLHEKRIAGIYRGGGPRGLTEADWRSFDGYLLELAEKQGARIRYEMVTDACREGGLPCLTTPFGRETYDLAVVAAGVNSRLLDKFEAMGIGYQRPKTTAAFISEFHLGEEVIEQQLQSAMHVFLLNLPRLEFAALIPKKSFVTVCLLGDDIDDELVESFLNAPEVRRCFPAASSAVRKASCHCFPRINVEGSKQPFADRTIFIGDAGVTRLYKDGIGAAYRTSKAAATAAILGGVSEADLRAHFLPACRRIAADNAIGKVVFWANNMVKGFSFTRRAMVRMTAVEQRTSGMPRDMSNAMWDLFTGSAPYREILLRSLNPRFLGRLFWNAIMALWPASGQTYRQEEQRESR